MHLITNLCAKPEALTFIWAEGEEKQRGERDRVGKERRKWHGREKGRRKGEREDMIE